MVFVLVKISSSFLLINVLIAKNLKLFSRIKAQASKACKKSNKKAYRRRDDWALDSEISSELCRVQA